MHNAINQYSMNSHVNIHKKWTRLARDIFILFFVFFLLTPPEFNAPALLSDLSGSSGVCDWNLKNISRRDVHFQFEFNCSPRWRRAAANFSSASFCSSKISCWPCSAFGWMFVRFDTTQLDNWLSQQTNRLLCSSSDITDSWWLINSELEAVFEIIFQPKQNVEWYKQLLQLLQMGSVAPKWIY